jgi:cytosine/uracil/thiamine/allantoin permease
MKTLNWIALISGGIGLVFVLLGLIQLLFGKFIQGTELINYFHAGNSFFLITIALFLYLHLDQHKKE